MLNKEKMSTIREQIISTLDLPAIERIESNGLFRNRYLFGKVCSGRKRIKTNLFFLITDANGNISDLNVNSYCVITRELKSLGFKPRENNLTITIFGQFCTYYSTPFSASSANWIKFIQLGRRNGTLAYLAKKE